MEKAVYGPVASYVRLLPLRAGAAARGALRVLSSWLRRAVWLRRAIWLCISVWLLTGADARAQQASQQVTGQPVTGQPVTGQPVPWQIGLQPPVTDVARSAQDFHNLLLWITGGVVVLVTVLLIVVIVRFNEKANPSPARFTHNTWLEVTWTVVPILVLAVIAVPSFRLLRAQLIIPPSDITVKVTGHQWYWNYEYPAEQGGFTFDSVYVPDDDLTGEQPRLLAVDNEVVLPVDSTVRLQVTAADVIHGFAVPSFGIKIDAIPGRLNETWFSADREGIYYGQCSLICGQNHAYMPIAIRIVSAEQYAAWREEAKARFTAAGD